MTYIRRLLLIELLAHIAHIVTCTLLTVTFTADYLMSERYSSSISLMEALAGSAAVFGAFYFYGLIPVVVYGAPAYSILEHFNRAHWVYVIAVGILPGPLVAWLYALQPVSSASGGARFALVFAGCGLTVACMTHLLSKRRLSVKNGL